MITSGIRVQHVTLPEELFESKSGGIVDGPATEISSWTVDKPLPGHGHTVTMVAWWHGGILVTMVYIGVLFMAGNSVSCPMIFERWLFGSMTRRTY